VKHVESRLQLSVYTSSVVESSVYNSNFWSLVLLDFFRDMTLQPRLGDVAKPIICKVARYSSKYINYNNNRLRTFQI
jgi:hypothetical protein